MKSLILSLVLVVMSFLASAQDRRPRYRIPLPEVSVGFRCNVVMIDGWHRVLRRYSGRTLTGRCSTAA